MKKWFSISFIVVISSINAIAEVVVLKDWTAIRGINPAGNEKVLNITEIQSKKMITIRRSDIYMVIEESLLDEETLNNYRKVNWKDFDYNKLGQKKQELDKQKAEQEKKRIEQEKKKAEAGESFTGKYRPRIGLHSGLSIPTGGLGADLGSGLLTLLFNDYVIPYVYKNFRAGMLMGYGSYSSIAPDFKAEINLIPIVPYAEISYHTEIGLAPYFRLGTGISFTSLTDNSGGPQKRDASATDLALLIGTGIGYINEDLPFMEFGLDFTYMRIFEKVSGDFFNASLGVSYHFYTER
jgi:hypothetical protein